MRNAVMVSQTEFPKKNIGDYVQAIAAQQFSPNATFVQREHLKDYDGEPVRMIMNGWFMIHPEQFPPSEKIKPLYISFHMNPTNAAAMLANGGLEHLKKHEPIGCRDNGTVAILRTAGIEAYFSGCLTLTLGKTYKLPDGAMRHGIYFVDPAFDIHGGKFYWASLLFKSIGTILTKPFLLLRISRKIVKISWIEHWEEISTLKRWLYTLDFYRLYSKWFGDDVLDAAEFVEQHVRQDLFKNEEAKFELADSMLKKYQSAELVVTGRIHAALPCTGMGTPVVFTNLERQNSGTSANIGRLNGLLEFFNIIEMGAGDAAMKFSIDSPDCKIHINTPVPRNESWRTYADTMADKAMMFMQGTEGK